MISIEKPNTVSACALLAGLIDYAGLFPPASLSMAEAWANYAAYARHPDSWMLGRFVVPAVRLAELGEVAGTDFASGGPFRFAVLGRGGSDVATWWDGVRADVALVEAFRHLHGPAVTAEVFETRVPDGLGAETGREAVHTLRQAGLTPFFEPAAGKAWVERVHALAQLLQRCNEDAPTLHAGVKLRCGGVTADAFPSVEELAEALHGCHIAGVPLKATAGLHHPVRHFAESIGTPMHGFLNFFGAAILATLYNLAPEQIVPILADEAPENFFFTEATFAWQHLAATPTEVRNLRERAFLSYGSCSFDEPREDLRALGVLA